MKFFEHIRDGEYQVRDGYLLEINGMPITSINVNDNAAYTDDDRYNYWPLDQLSNEDISIYKLTPIEATLADLPKKG